MAEGLERLAEAWERAARAAVRSAEYSRLWPAVVLRDHGDHHVDLRPLNPDMPDMVRVPYSPGLPGARCRVRPGAVAYLTCEEGDPERPRVVGWLQADLEWLRLQVGQAFIEMDASTGHVMVGGARIDLGG